MHIPAGQPEVTVAEWKAIVAKHQQPSAGRATWQLANSIGAYAALWVVMYFGLSVSWWLVTPLAVLAGMVLVRVFIIFHDCGHGSFFPSRLANDITGFITGALTLTPYHHWRWEHSIHHASSGDLDRRGTGDLWTMTVDEYLASSRWRRLAYRLARHPLTLFTVGPLYMLVIHQRVPKSGASPRERNSVWWMNLTIAGMVVALGFTFGWKQYLLIQLIVTAVAGGIGLWLFYVQHQFEHVSWERREDWDFTSAALEGSSFYKLPRILQWFTGNIGFHHIHHLSARIPNYNLERCHNSHPLFLAVKPVTFFASFKALTLHLWDEQRRKLVGFRRIRELRREARLRQQSGERA